MSVPENASTKQTTILPDILIEWSALPNLPHLGTHAFDAHKNLTGDFIYSTNKTAKRYSPMYASLNDESYIHSQCAMEMGYTDLLVCRKAELVIGHHKIAETKFDFPRKPLSVRK